ncbi:MAG: LysR substrate-binding domain-containing protein [Acidimicrobiia bacterium]
MNLRDLEYLVALAEHRNFGRAAAACYVSQPTLSAQIRKLERELDVALVERDQRRVLLTPAGEQVAAQAAVVLRGVDDLRHLARLAADPETATIRIGTFPTSGPYLLPHIMTTLRSRFPRLELLLAEAKTEALLQDLRSGSLDAAVLAMPVTEDGLDCSTLFDERFVLAVPEGHPLASGEDLLPLDVLGGEDLLLLDEGHCLRDQALSVCELAGAHERRGFRATSLETLRHMVASGTGVTLLPELAVRPPVPLSEGVVLRRFAAPEPSRTLALCWRSSSPLRPLLGEVADVIRKAVAELG